MGRMKGMTSAPKKRASSESQADDERPATRLRTPSTSRHKLDSAAGTKTALVSQRGSKIVDFFPSRDSAVHSFTSTSTKSSDTSPSTSFATTVSDATTVEEFETREEYDSNSGDAGLFLPPSPTTCEERLKNIWPKFPCHTFSEAPLAVQWEVCRLALHCGVDLSSCDINYDTPSEWCTQEGIREQLGSQGPFKGKEMPPVVDSATWTLALSTCQTRDKAIRFLGELCLNPNGKTLFTLKLEPLRIECSYRLQRRFGADRFLEITLPSLSRQAETSSSKGPDVGHTVIRWLVEKKHYFLSRQWASFFCRVEKSSTKIVKGKPTKSTPKNKLYLFACNGDAFVSYGKRSLPPCEHATKLNMRVKMPVHELIQWAIGLSKSSAQTISKLFSRIGLSMTDAQPTVVLERHQIIEKASDLGRAQPMNDGVGQMSKSLAKKIARILGLVDVPCAFQGRIGSAKGMWVIDIDQDETADWIETYPSQRKWHCDHEDIHHRTFEVKNWSKEPRAAALNQQFIPVLEAQAIDPSAMRECFKYHLENSLIEEMAAQKEAMNHPADLRLFMQGLSSRSDKASLGYTPFLAGLPRDKPDEIKFLLDAGFVQTELHYLQRLCLDISTQDTGALKEKFNIRVPCSAYLFMVADFSATLKPNEVHVSFSTKFQCDEFCDTLLEKMDVLVARAPAHLPGDIQRVKAVSKPGLRHLKDVIVFSTQGDSSLADLLSGGDYDGDQAWVCWDQKIVQNFCNAPPLADNSDPLQLGILRRSDRTIRDIKSEEGNAQGVCLKFLYEAFCFNMRPRLLGLCTGFKDDYCYYYGYRGHEAVVFSRLLGCLVDQAKQGFLFDMSDWKMFQRDFLKTKHLPTPQYKLESRAQVVTRSGKVHILDYLKHDVADAAIKKTLCHLQEALDSGRAPTFDGDLTELYRHYAEAYEHNADWKKIEKQLIEDVDAVARLWADLMSQSKRAEGEEESFAKAAEKVYEKWLGIQPARRQQSTVLAQELMCGWMKDKDATCWALMKASIAFRRHHNRESFIWRIAGLQLATLKARANPVDGSASATVVPTIWAGMRMDKKFVAGRRALREAERMKGCEVAEAKSLDVDDFSDVDI